MSRKWWPNLLSTGRIALAPVLLAAALAGSRPWFLILLAVALASDALDGFLARWLQAESDLGRRLDSLGDYLTVTVTAAGIWLLWPQLVRSEWPWFIAALTGYFAIVVYGLLRWGRLPGYHTWAAKALGVALPLALGPLLAGWSATPFHAVVVLQVAVSIEEFAIAWLLPGHAGEVRSAWHARQLRRPDAGEALAPPEIVRTGTGADARES